MIRWFENYFFSPGSALRLGITRCLFFAAYAFQLLVYKPVILVDLDDSYWLPIVVLRLFDAPPVELKTTLLHLMLISAFLSCLGLFTRISTVITAFLGLYLFGVMNSYGLIGLHLCPIVVMAFILAFSSCGDAFSLDALIRKDRIANSFKGYTWPIKLGQITFVILMSTAGLQKLTENWLSQPLHNMDYWFRYKCYAQAKLKGSVIPEFVMEFLNHDWLLFLMAVFMLLAESLCFLALVKTWPKIRYTVIGSLFFMQAFLAFGLKTLSTFPWLGAYLFFIPWESFYSFLSHKFKKRAALKELKTS